MSDIIPTLTHTVKTDPFNYFGIPNDKLKTKTEWRTDCEHTVNAL